MTEVTWSFMPTLQSTSWENAKLKCSKISILQNCQINMQLNCSVLQYLTVILLFFVKLCAIIPPASQSPPWRVPSLRSVSWTGPVHFLTGAVTNKRVWFMTNVSVITRHSKALLTALISMILLWLEAPVRLLSDSNCRLVCQFLWTHCKQWIPSCKTQSKFQSG